jgi:hypothetical protein
MVLCMAVYNLTEIYRICPHTDIQAVYVLVQIYRSHTGKVSQSALQPFQFSFPSHASQLHLLRINERAADTKWVKASYTSSFRPHTLVAQGHIH